MTQDEEVIWATSTTGDDFQCVHVDDWREAKARIAVLEAALRDIAGGEISGHDEIVVRSDSMIIAHEALEKK